MTAGTARTPRSSTARSRGGHHAVLRAEELRRIPVVQLPGQPGRPQAGRAAQGREAGAVPGVLGAGPRPAVSAGAGRGAAREQDLRGVPRAERTGPLAEAGGPGRHRHAGARRGLSRHPGAASRASSGPRRGTWRIWNSSSTARGSSSSRRSTTSWRSRAWCGGSPESSLRPPDGTRYEGVCPYLGLEAFRPGGREVLLRPREPDGLAGQRPAARGPGGAGVRFLGVLGPSGSGKSSVVLAGLVPSLKEGAIEGSEHWPIAILRPGTTRSKNLAAAVVSRFLPAGALPDVGRSQAGRRPPRRRASRSTSSHRRP